MPIYEYRCTACQHKLEALQKFSDPPLVTCPHCAKDALTKLVSAAGFQLKGSGWYQTDFRGGSKPAEKSDAPAADAKSAEPAKSDKAEPAAAKSESPTPAAGPAATA
ncbi:MAG: zinc ribbon domain-containing protein [Burkholderiales bacterium]